MTLRETLAHMILDYAAATGIDRARLSRRLFRDGRRANLIVAGEGDVTTGTYEKAMRWFSENWPDDRPWPDGVDRPSPEPSIERAKP